MSFTPPSQLKWLPVSSRIEIKIFTLTLKVLKFQQPEYFLGFDGTLRSSKVS